ncbi:MAG: 3-oxoacyl-[acyl-carrier-protein] synthase III C-terminal domain-containing protein [bacterium]|jgi:predicted naringenin-chalcone synthase
MQTILRVPATANPPFYVTQQDAYEFYVSHFALTPEEQTLYHKLLIDGPIQGRYFGLDCAEDACETNPDRLNERFVKFARQTGAAAARKAITEAGLTVHDLGGVVVNTCTGYLCPGLSSYLVEDLGLPSTVKTLDIAGMGCGGALPNIDTASALLAANDGLPWLSVAVEACSATLFMGPDPALIVSNCIFGDGAAAVILQNESTLSKTAGLMRILGSTSSIHPKYREQLRYRQEQGRLRNVLTTRVPVIGAKLAGEALNTLLTQHQLTREDISWWAVHAGGTAVLDQVGRDLGLDAKALQYSLNVFHTYGNMSSPSVLFALKQIIEQGQPKPGDRGVLLSFGAGFSAFAMLVEFL